MSEVSEVRKTVKQILKKYNVDAKFSIRNVSFQDLARSSVYFIEFKDIHSIPLEQRIKIIDEIKENKIYIS